jgi:fido (protein-threonine AMPylation protein)
MSDPLFDGDDEANTPITEDEREDLIPSYITVREELNEAEQINIAQANRWLARTRGFDILNDDGIRALHKRMFGDVWKWAGAYRKTPRNIGIEAY